MSVYDVIDRALLAVWMSMNGKRGWRRVANTARHLAWFNYRLLLACHAFRFGDPHAAFRVLLASASRLGRRM